MTPSILKIYQMRQVEDAEWTDWRWQLQHIVTRGQELFEFGLISKKRANEIDTIISTTSEQMRLTPYLISLIDWDREDDPIAIQHIPNKSETVPDKFSFSTVWEPDRNFLSDQNQLLEQKYPDIMVMRLSNTCHSFCRFCFQKQRTLRREVSTTVSEAAISAAIKTIAVKTNVRQILISGGDPLIFTDDFLGKIIERLIKIPHLSSIRINTRTFVHNPFRITEDFAGLLSQLQKNSWGNSPRGKNIYIGTHFNHPRELTTDALTAIRRLKRANLNLYNQTVLLKSINDSWEILATLFKKLREENIELHYLSEAMAVPGTDHFRIKVARGQEIMRELRRQTEFRGQLPHFELSHYTGKQIIPDTMNENFYESEEIINGKKISHIKFLSDVTHQWETFPDAND